MCEPKASSKGRLLTAVEATREFNWIGLLVIAMCQSATNARSIAPNHLGEVSRTGRIDRVVIRVLGLLLVPAVGGGAGELDPLGVVTRDYGDSRQVGAGVFLYVDKSQSWGLYG